MKKSINLLFTTLCIIGMQAQIKPTTKLPNKNPFPISSSNLDLERIKQHITSNKFCYEVSMSSTAIIPPKQLKAVKAVDGYFSSTKYVKVERNYLRMNGLFLRSDRAYNRSRGETYEILIYPNRSDKRKIDLNQVKLTWRSAEKGLKTFLLKNVNVQYKPYGIVIIGDYEIDGMIFGVTIGLKPGDCLK